MINCRSCNGKLSFLFTLGDLYINDFPKPGIEGVKSPLDLCKCLTCHLVQLGDGLKDEYYSHFWYESGTSPTMKEALRSVCNDSMKYAKPPLRDKTVLDIGCNDGTLLRFYPRSMVKVGFEPASNVADKARDSGFIFNQMFQASPYLKMFERAKIVTSIAMFYDLSDPNTFTADLAKTLDDEGVWVNQMNYLPAMLTNNAYDNICHEHLEYYSLTSLSHLLDRHGLEPFRAEENNVNAGSFRVYIAHKGAYAKDETVNSLLGREEELGLDMLGPYRAFEERIMKLRDQLQSFIEAAMSAGRKVYVYGASTRGNTLLQYSGLHNPIITAACDANPDKWGRVTVGTNIPIISKDQARKDHPDYFLVLPYHFLEEIRKQERDYIANGGRFIVPLPSFRVVS